MYLPSGGASMAFVSVIFPIHRSDQVLDRDANALLNILCQAQWPWPKCTPLNRCMAALQPEQQQFLANALSVNLC